MNKYSGVLTQKGEHSMICLRNFVLSCMTVLVLLFIGCAGPAKAYQQLGVGSDSLSLGWAVYPDEGFGMLGSLQSTSLENSFTGESETARGIQLGVTRKVNSNWGVPAGFSVINHENDFGGFSFPEGGWVFGAQYFTENGYTLGVQADTTSNDALFILGIDDPLWLISAILNDDDGDDH
ncbi:MAG: hypothetical protein GWP38_11210 [Planctomycetia bacterium]|nr:hypothetical protein [Planctomycetia bacterium]